MRTLNAQEAAEFLKIDVDTFYARAAAGDIPAAKEGRAWVCIDDDLAQHLRTKYRQKADSEGTPWGTIKETPTATLGYRTPRNLAAQYEQALRPRPKGSKRRV